MSESINNLKEKYGLFTAITTVVGSVVGVGIFLRAPSMALGTGGDVNAILLSWIVAAIMIFPIAILISEVSSVKQGSSKGGGIQDYAHRTIGGRFGFGVGFIQTFFYIPSLIALIAFLAANYTLKVAGKEDLGVDATIAIALFYVVGLFVMNLISARVGGYFQIISTLLKLIPLVAVAIVGLFYVGDPVSVVTLDGIDQAAIDTYNARSMMPDYMKIAYAIPAALFAFEGWIYVGLISKEIKKPSVNIPIAVIGSLLFIVILYVLFIYSSFQVASPMALALGTADNKYITSTLFGGVFSNFLDAFIMISALGVANASILTLIRAPYYLLQDYNMPFINKLSKNNVPVNSGIVSLIIAVSFILIPYFIWDVSDGYIYGLFTDASVLMNFAIYLLICIGMFVAKQKGGKAVTDQLSFKAPLPKVLLTIGTIGVCFGIYSLLMSYSTNMISVIVYIALASIGFIVYKKHPKSAKSN